jgi:NAD-dependent dihydropyrimidine dehydrogenase PreA subunit
MIELLSDKRCVACDVCVKVCPTNVFDAVPDAAPVIARQEDCQTCFMCELYCPTDALFVAPEADNTISVHEDTLENHGVLGSYRTAIGWGRGQSPTARIDASYRVLALVAAPESPSKKPPESRKQEQA